MTSRYGPTAHERRFAEYLGDLVKRQDRASLAAIRRGLQAPPGEVAEVHRYVVPWLPQEIPRWTEDCYYIVASLFASHQISWIDSETSSTTPYTNLGASFARLAAGGEGDSVERRFTAVLNSDREDVHIHLRHAVSLLKSKDVPIDWAQLLNDLRFWGPGVHRRWARAFWSHSSMDLNDEQSAVAAAQ